MDKITSSGKLDKTQKEIQEKIGAPVLLEANVASIASFPPDQQSHAAEWFAGDAYFISFRNAFQNLCKVGSGKAWLSRLQKIIVTVNPAPPQQTTDTAFIAQVQEPIFNITVFLRANRSLRSAYNPRGLEEAIVLALPQLKTGQDMDKVSGSGKIEKTQQELQDQIGSPVFLEVDLYSIANMPQDDCKYASEYVAGDGMFITFRNAFQNLCKVGSGKAWLQRFQQISVTFVPNHDLKTDSSYTVSAAEPVLNIIINLRTTHSLRSAYNPRGLEEAITASLPQLKMGQDMDKITSSGKLEKTQKEVQDQTGNPALVVEFNLYSITNMNIEDCKYASEWISGDGYFITFRNAFQNICKVGSGKAWLSRFQKIAINAVSNRDQKTDTVFDVQAIEPVLNMTVTLRTSHTLRSAYNPRGLEEAIYVALPQLKTGQDMDKVTSSGKIEKTQKELQDQIASQVVLEVDLFSISNGMPIEDAKYAAEFISGDGMFITFRNAFQNICKVGSGKAWLQRFQKVTLNFVANRDQKTDSVFNVVAQEPVLAVTASLRTSHTLRSAYNPRGLEEAIYVALPQLKTGQDMDKINSSGKLEKTQKEIQDQLGNPAMVVEVDLFAIANMPLEDCHNASEYFSGDGWFITARNSFTNLKKKGNFAQFMSQFQKILVSPTCNRDQPKDSIFNVVAQPGVLQVQISLRTSHTLRSAYDPRGLEEAIARAGGL